MAATNVKVLNQGDKTFLAAKAMGTGAPADGDAICTDLALFPIGSEYLDTTNSKLWRRITADGDAADWVGVALA